MDLISQIKNLPGEIFIFNHGFVNHISGKTSYIHSSPYSDVISAGEDSGFIEKRRMVSETLSDAIKKLDFQWVIIDKEYSNWYPYYIYVRDFKEIENDIRPMTGVTSVPQSLMVKNPIASGGQLVVYDHNYNSFFRDGWSDVAEARRWINNHHARMNVPLETDRSYTITITGSPSCENGEPLINNITLSWNDASMVTQQQITGCGEVRLTYDISSNMLIEGANSLSIELDILPITSSSKESISTPRNLFELTNFNVSR